MKYKTLWSEEEYILTISLYFHTQPKERDEKNSRIIELAELLGRTPASVALRLANYASIDSVALQKGLKGLNNKGVSVKHYFNKYSLNRVELDRLAEVAKKSKLLSLESRKRYIEENAKDASFQHEVQEAQPENIAPGPQPLPKPNVGGSSIRWTAKAGISKNCCEKAQYTCESDPAHVTFVSKATNKYYVEAHHLIPISRQGEFQYRIDVPENILILCPLCHRKFHHALSDHQNPLLERFYFLRKKALETRGIFISLEKLQQYYS